MRETCTSGSVGAVGGNPRGDPTVPEVHDYLSDRKHLGARMGR